MLTNTERQQIVEEVNAGTYGIDEALDDIAAAQKGEEVRKALYAEALVLNREGHAGSTDMIARQQIANLQTSVNGQISTLRTEVGEDIAGMQTALNGSLAAQDGKIAAQDATIANVVANYNVEYGSTELWASTGETGALAAGTTVTLSEDVSHFDYIDIYSFCGNSNVLDTVPVDAKLQSNAGYALRWVNLSDPGSGTYEAYVRIVETKINIIGTTLTIVHQVTYRNGSAVSVSGAEITQSNRSTYVGEFGIMKVVGRKITANTEVTDIRTGADGTAYNSAGAAVRAQVQALNDAIPAVDDTLSVQGAAADAAAVGLALAGQSGSGSGITDEIKQALLGCFSHVAWATDDAQAYYDMLETALYPPANLVGISATYTQGGAVYDTDSLDDLKSDLVVTATYDNASTATVTAYMLSGTLSIGTSSITVTYGGKSTTFNVTVTADPSNEVLTTFAGSSNMNNTTFNIGTDSNTWTTGSTILAKKLTFEWDIESASIIMVRICQFDSNDEPYKQNALSNYGSNPVTDGTVWDTNAKAWADPGVSGKFCAIGTGTMTINMPTTGKVNIALRRTSSATGTISSNAAFGEWVMAGGIKITAHA